MDFPSKDALVTLLRDLANQIQSLDETEVTDVMSGRLKLEVRVEGKRPPNAPKRTKLPDDAIQQIADMLRTIRSRDEGFKILMERLQSKGELTRIARYLDVPVQKSDSVDQIRARLVESTIGFRLRSAAIQGDSAVVPNNSVRPAE